jgi:release factor glutamine methyltransferase
MPIYQPSEDSYLLSRVLDKEIPKLLIKNSKLKFLEIGAGSGINLETASRLGIKKESIFSCDIDKNAVSHCNLLGFNCVYSDLFKNLKGKYDIIIFNPPYLPLDKKEPKDSQLATTGGKKGNELSIKFLKQAKNYLKDKGIILLVTSSLTKPINFRKLGYFSLIVDYETLFFEKIYVWKLKLNEK